jgi:hypothetical protein
MAIEIPESVEAGFLSSHPSSAERFLSLERVANTLKEGLDPLKIFAFNGTRDQKPEQKLRAELPEPRGSRTERHGHHNRDAVAQAD